MMMVLVLLGVLAYGSFAFGKYVLSAKLFGENVKTGSAGAVSRSTTQASAITRQTGWKGAKPRVDVKVLPADQTGAAPDLPAYADEDGFNKKPRARKADADQPTRMATDSSSNDSGSSSADLSLKKSGVKRNVDDGAVEYSLGGENGATRRNKISNDNNDSNPPRRRRRRRNRSARTDNPTRTTSNKPAVARNDGAPVGDGRDEDASISVTTDHSPRRETSPRRPRRTRERPRRESSPVPRPESSGGSDSGSISPVPQPE